MLYGILVFIYVIVSIFLIAVVLLQTGKRADLAGAFGGGGSQSAFGARGAANAFTKMTTAAAVAFMVIALVLSVMSRGVGGQGSVLDDTEGNPAAPSAPAPDGSEGDALGLPPVSGTPDASDPEADPAPAEGDASTGSQP